YHEYGLVPATLTTAAAMFIGFSRIYGNQHHLSDVLAGYAIGLGWGIVVETYQRHQSRGTLVPISEGRTMAGLALHLRWDGGDRSVGHHGARSWWVASATT